MGYVKKRIRKDGKPRFTACYLDIKGRERSAGTYATEKEADKAWQRAEVKVSEGRITSPKHSRQRFATYVLDTWLPNHVMETVTRQNVTYLVHRYFIPEFGAMRMNEILPAHIQEWVRACQERGLAASTIQRMVSVLSAIFSTALYNQIVFLHPCKGVVLPTVGSKPLTIITPEQFEEFHAHIRGEVFQLLVETGIESGLRWGELSELRPKDLDPATGILTVSRAVVQVKPQFHPSGGRFLVKDYPKDKEYRRLKISRSLVGRITEFIHTHHIREEDLLFAMPDSPSPPLKVLPGSDDLGLTAPNAQGRQYRHGTMTAYTNGRCRCQHCRTAYATYRASRRAQGKDHPRNARSVDTDGHIPAGWFRRQIWHPARERAGIPKEITPKHLRHAHASWILAGGADLQVVKERLGHASITTTQRYLHTLPEADETALEAFNTIRSRTNRRAGSLRAAN